MMELRGDISGLLRRGSPVSRQSGSGVVVRVLPGVLSDVAVVGCNDGAMESVLVAVCTLDLSDPTGRFHAREWLRERGHDVDSEDRADVLAWSVLSVHRGGKPLRVAGKWTQYGDRRPSFSRPLSLSDFASVRLDGWSVSSRFRRVASGYEAGNAGKDACDAALLRLGWALTNADGSFTLPPLPEVYNG